MMKRELIWRACLLGTLLALCLFAATASAEKIELDFVTIDGEDYPQVQQYIQERQSQEPVTVEELMQALPKSALSRPLTAEELSGNWIAPLRLNSSFFEYMSGIFGHSPEVAARRVSFGIQSSLTGELKILMSSESISLEPEVYQMVQDEDGVYGILVEGQMLVSYMLDMLIMNPDLMDGYPLYLVKGTADKDLELQFGSFEQDGDIANGPEPIEWLILEREDNRALIVSKSVLKTAEYDQTLEWINGDFIDLAFSSGEKAALLETQRSNGDKFFIPDEEEARTYLMNDDRQAFASPYVQDENTPISWWLEGERWTDENGEVVTDEVLIALESGKSRGVRPACWIDLDLFNQETGWAEWAQPYAEVGNIVKLGHYEQNNISMDGKEPIEWIVLDTRNGKSLLLARKALDRIVFGKEVLQDYSWSHSYIRHWLNGEFMEDAFSEQEREAIQTTLLSNPGIGGDGYYSGGGCEDTADNVFALDEREVIQYLPNEADRICTTTEYGVAQKFRYIGSAEEPVEWWTRTTGSKDGICAVAKEGELAMRASDTVDMSVRPAMWISLDVLSEEAVAQANESAGADEEAMAETMAVISLPGAEKFGVIGQTVSFGSFEQDGDESNGTEAVEWLVLDTDGAQSLLLSVYGLQPMRYSNEVLNSGWAGSEVRKWLSESFLTQAFSEEERRCIRETPISTPEYLGHSGGDDTLDKVFVLSADEARRYFADEKALLCDGTADAVRNGAKSGKPCEWWLRSMPSDPYLGISVDGKGMIDTKVIADKRICVRPAMWVDLGMLGALPHDEAESPTALPTDAPIDKQELDTYDPFDDY